MLPAPPSPAGFTASFRFPRLRVTWVAWAVLAVSLSATAWGWHLARESDERVARERFQFRVNEIRQSLQDRLLAYEQVLRSGVGLFAASQEVSRKEWRSFVDNLSIQERFPGIQGIGFSLLVPAQDKDSHEQRIRREGFPGYQIRPPGTRTSYSSIIYLEPFDWRNQRAFGYDMFSEPVRNIAMSRARDSGKSAISGKVTLVQETEKDVQAGFLMYAPLYRPDSWPLTVESRRAALVGWVYAPFRMNDFMRGLLGQKDKDVDLEIFDGAGADPQREMYDSDGSRALPGPRRQPRLLHVEALPVFGHAWTLEISSRPTFEAVVYSRRPFMVLLAGLSISLLLFLVTHALAAGRARATELAVRMTRASHENEMRLAEITATLGEGVVVLDSAGNITFANPEAQNLLGWSEVEMLGRRGHELFHHSRPDGSYYPAAECATELLNREGQDFRGEEVLWTREGAALPVAMISTPLWREGAVSGTVVAFHDIRYLKKTEAKLKRLNESLEQQVAEQVERNMAQERMLVHQSRLAAMGEMIGNIAHQWRQPLNALGLLLANVKDSWDYGELNQETLEKFAEDGNRLIQNMSTTIDDFRNFFRPNRAKAPFGLAQSAHDALGLVEASFRSHGVAIRLENMVPLQVQGYANEFAQVLLNVLSNARDAILAQRRGGGEVSLTLAEEDGMGVVTVRDNGGGIPDDVLPRIFEPYFTTKEKGTGIGLYMSRLIMDHMDGLIDARNIEGGAEMRLRVPLARDENASG